MCLNFIRFQGLAISDWLFIGSFIIALFETFQIDQKNQFCWLKNRYLPYAYLLLIGATISMFRANNLQIAFVELFQLLYVITIYISLIWIMKNRGKLELVLKTFVISGFFSAAVACVDYVTGAKFGPMLSNNLYGQLWGRYAGTLGHPNKFGYFLVITAICTIFLIVSNKKLNKIFWIFCLLIQIMGIYLSGSLTAYLGLLLGFSSIFVNLAVRKQISVPGTLLIIFLLLTIFSVAAIFSGAFDKNSTNIQNNTILTAIDRVRLTTAGSRLVIYNEAIQASIKSPIVGVGFDQVATSGVSENKRDISGTVHNSVIQVIYVGGIVACLGFILIYADLVRNSMRVILFKKKRSQSFMYICLAAASLAIILMDQFQSSLYLREKWLAVGIFASLMWSELLPGENSRIKK